MSNGAHKKTNKKRWGKIQKCTKIDAFPSFASFVFLCHLFALCFWLHPLFSTNMRFSPFLFHTLHITSMDENFKNKKTKLMKKWGKLLDNDWKLTQLLKSWNFEVVLWMESWNEIKTCSNFFFFPGWKMFDEIIWEGDGCWGKYLNPKYWAQKIDS